MSKGKEQMRKALSSLSFTEKIRILEKLRDRSLSLAEWGLRRQAASKQIAAEKERKSN